MINKAKMGLTAGSAGKVEPKGTRGYENGKQETGDHVGHAYDQVQGEPITAAVIKTRS